MGRSTGNRSANPATALSARAQGRMTRDRVIALQREQGPNSAAERAIRNSVNARRRTLASQGQGNRVAAFNRGLAGG